MKRPSLATRFGPWGALALLLAAAATAYRPALAGPFQLDDWNAIQANARLRAPDALALPSPAALLGPGRPVTEATFALDIRSAGLNPFRFHVVGLLLHLLAAALVFVFTRSLLRRAGHARATPLVVLVAGVFALHPIQTEAVAYAAQRSEVLASILYLVTLLLLDRAGAARSLSGAVLPWGAGLLAWLLAMGAKSIAISAPGAFVLDQAVIGPGMAPGASRPGPRARFRRALLLASPLFALVVWSAALHFRAFAAAPGGGAGFTATALSPLRYFLSQLRVQWLYVKLLAWPHRLGLDRSFAPSEGLDGATALAGLGVLAAVGLALWLWSRAEQGADGSPAMRVASFGILFWFVVLAPTSSFVPVLDLAVEHRVYLASLGPILAAAVGLDAALQRWAPPRLAGRIGATASILVLSLLGIGLASRARVWSSAESLWRDADRTSPGSPRILTNLALALQMKGDLAGADASYRSAWTVAREPLHVIGLARNHSSLLVDSGNAAAALPVLDRGLRLSPDDPDLLGNRAAALSRLGRAPEALADARRAVEASPASPFFREMLGQLYASTGSWAEALPEFEAAARLDPEEPSYAVARATSLAAVGRGAEACEAFRAARVRFGPARLPADFPERAADAGCGAR
jgi:tetratricopeptide (TPR) repeat protein